jgi:hypothetical protein
MAGASVLGLGLAARVLTRPPCSCRSDLLRVTPGLADVSFTSVLNFSHPDKRVSARPNRSGDRGAECRPDMRGRCSRLASGGCGVRASLARLARTRGGCGGAEVALSQRLCPARSTAGRDRRRRGVRCGRRPRVSQRAGVRAVGGEPTAPGPHPSSTRANPSQGGDAKPWARPQRRVARLPKGSIPVTAPRPSPGTRAAAAAVPALERSPVMPITILPDSSAPHPGPRPATPDPQRARGANPAECFREAVAGRGVRMVSATRVMSLGGVQ